MAGLGRLRRVDALAFLGGAAPSAPAAAYAGFKTASPGDDGTGGTEPTIGTGGYARQSITWSTVATPALNAAAILQNANELTWGPSSDAWSTGATPLTHMEVRDSTTATTEASFFGGGALAVSRQVNAAGVTLVSAVAAVKFTLTPP